MKILATIQAWLSYSVYNPIKESR